jgi:aminoglycoside 2'-N-acetyltransferase I
MAAVHLLTTRDLDEGQRRGLRDLLDAAFAEFADTDWEHALGGWHAVVAVDRDSDGLDGPLLAHAAVVPRRLEFGGAPLHAGYVEAVATAPHAQGRGFGSMVMTELAGVMHREFDVGVLSTGRHAFYERLGWERWAGPTAVRQADGRVVRTPEDDDGIMVLRFGRSRQLLPTAPLVCDVRPGDDW